MTDGIYSAMPVCTKRRRLRVVLGALAALCLLRGLGHLIAPEVATPAALLLLPSPTAEAYAGLWLAGTVGCVAAIARLRWAPRVLAFGVGMHVLWALTFIAGWAVGVSSLGYLSAAQYVMTAVLLAVVAEMTAGAARHER